MGRTMFEVYQGDRLLFQSDELGGGYSDDILRAMQITDGERVGYAFQWQGQLWTPKKQFTNPPKEKPSFTSEPLPEINPATKPRKIKINRFTGEVEQLCL